MASYSDVNLVFNSIHNLIQSSGIHFVINQTPWSSYITLRRKFVKPATSASSFKSNVEVGELFNLREQNKVLEHRVTALENELVDTQEEYKDSEGVFEDKVQNLHSKIDNLEHHLAATELKLKNKELEVLGIKKEIVMKDEMIQNLNCGFNKKVADLKVTITNLENLKNETLKKEKKANKKQRQKSKKEEKAVLNDLNDDVSINNNTVGTRKTDCKDMTCEVCDKILESKGELQSHAITEHLEVLKRAEALFRENNTESLRLLENIPENNYIFTPEELTHFAMDWDIHLKLSEILSLKDTKEAESDE